MRGDPPEATLRLKRALPVTTHYQRKADSEVNKYTGKPVNRPRNNVWLPPSPKIER